MGGIKNEHKLLDSKPARNFLAQMVFGTGFTYLTGATGAVFLSGLAMLIVVSDVLTSYLSVISNICGIVILVFAAFLERFRSRKRLTVSLTALSKLATLFIVAIPALFPAGLRVAVFIPAVAVAFTLQAQATVALNNWLVAFIPEQRRGRYISLRQTLSLAVTVLFSLAGGYWMDAAGGEYIGFVIIFLAAFVMGLIEIAILLATPDSAAPLVQTARFRFIDSIRVPLRDSAYFKFAVYIGLFYLILNLSDSFTMVFMMKYLQLPYKTVTALYLLLSLPQVVLLGVCGRISDKRGHNFVLKASVWLFAGEELFLAFVTPRSYLVFIPLSFLIASVANAGFVVAVFNRRYELMPPSGRIVYDNFYSAAVGVGVIVGPMAGGALRGFLENSAVAALDIPFAAIRLVYLLAAVGILLLQAVCYRRV